MRPTAEAFAKVLLKHHSQFCMPKRRTLRTITDSDVQQCLITYGQLCRQAGKGTPTGSGTFLGEIHRLCLSKNLPPINALAVNGRTLVPGGNYPGRDWQHDIKRCIAAHYPKDFWD
jgi:hypothetical protein